MALFFVGISFSALSSISKTGVIKECGYSKSNVNQTSIIKQDETLIAVVSPVIINVTSTENNVSILSIPESFSLLGEVKDPGIIMQNNSNSNGLSFSNKEILPTFAVANF